MKTFKLLFLFLAITAGTFYSCSDSNPIESESNAQKSIALRTTISELKKAHNITGRSSADSVFCFDFVYPITFSFNNGTTVTVTSFQGLLDIISNESPELYLEGVVFPFQVMQEGQVTTIDDENEFAELLVNCGIDTINDELETSYCFDVVFPISITGPDGLDMEILNMEGLTMYMNSPSNGYETYIVFPISVIYDNEVIEVNSLYEFYEIIDNCDTCACNLEYAPVCVQTADNGIMEFGNICFALCAGYTQNDIVDCNPTNDCDITALTVQTGECNPSGSYALTLSFSYNNAGNTHFEVHNNNGLLVGTYALSDLPVTIASYPHSGQGADYLTVNIVGNTACSATQQWATPNCGGEPEPCVCPTVVDPVCVMTNNGIVQYGNACLAMCDGHTQADFIECGVAPESFAANLGSCIQISYPVSVQFEGQVITVNSDSHLLQYYYPAMTTMPVFVYPITVTLDNTTHAINNQSQFESLISTSCN